jgi:hypothetical protein
MLNEHTFIEKGTEKIALVSRMGNNFKKAGDINKASQGLSQKILKF